VTCRGISVCVRVSLFILKFANFHFQFLFSLPANQIAVGGVCVNVLSGKRRLLRSLNPQLLLLNDQPGMLEGCVDDKDCEDECPEDAACTCVHPELNNDKTIGLYNWIKQPGDGGMGGGYCYAMPTSMRLSSSDSIGSFYGFMSVVKSSLSSIAQFSPLPPIFSCLFPPQTLLHPLLPHPCRPGLRMRDSWRPVLWRLRLRGGHMPVPAGAAQPRRSVHQQQLQHRFPWGELPGPGHLLHPRVTVPEREV